MIRWVIDASALVDALVVEQPGNSLRAALRYERCVTPAIMDLDAAALLSRLVMTGALAEAEAVHVLGDVQAAPVQRFAHAPLLARTWQLRAHTGVYGAAYLALADVLGVSLLTSDRRLEDASVYRCDRQSSAM